MSQHDSSANPRPREAMRKIHVRLVHRLSADDVDAFAKDLLVALQANDELGEYG